MRKEISVDIYHNKTFVKSYDDESLFSIQKHLKIIYSRYQGSKRIYEKTVNLYDRDTKSFPTAYLERLADLLDSNGIDVSFVDYRKYHRNTVRLPKLVIENERWENQKLLINALNDHNVGYISSVTGSGKSTYIRDIVDQMRVRTLILAPTEVIRDQLAEMLSENYGKKNVSTSLKSYSYSVKQLKKDTKRFKPRFVDINADIKEDSVPEEELYLQSKGYKKIGSSHVKVRKSDSSKKESTNYPDILVICPNSIKNLPLDYIQNALEMLIVDEGHIGTTEDIRFVLDEGKNLMYRYSVSATNWRDRKEDMLVFVASFGSKIVFEEAPSKSIERKIVKKPQYIQISAPTPDEWLGDIKNPDELIKRCIVGNRTRNSKIIEITKELLSMDRRVMICTEEAAHAILLKDRLVKEGIPAIEYYSEMNAKQKREAQKIASHSKDKFVIVSTMALSIGADTKAVDSIIIASGGKATIKIAQRAGRGSRRDGDLELLIYDFFDFFNKTTIKWALNRKKFLEWYYTTEDSVVGAMAKKHKVKIN